MIEHTNTLIYAFKALLVRFDAKGLLGNTDA